MKIGIDCRGMEFCINSSATGIGQYQRAIVRNIISKDHETEYILFTDKRNIDYKKFQKKNVRVFTIPFSRWKKYLPFIYSHIIAPCYFMLHKLDILHGLSNGFPLLYFGRTMVTVHDLAIYIHPEWFPSGQWFSRKIVVPCSIRRAMKIIAVSQSTKRDLCRIFRVSPEKVEVVYHGPGDTLVQSDATKDLEKLEEVGVRKPYILSLCTLEPRKNITNIIRAFDEIGSQEEFHRLQLVIAGKRGWGYQPILEAVRASPIRKRIIELGFVDEPTKQKLFRNAECFVYPSLYEGFGLPLLEAMSLGAPSITARNSSLEEIAGNGAWLLQKNTISELCSALRMVAGSKEIQSDLCCKGKKQAQFFSWDSSARRTINIYKQCYEFFRKDQ